jgi:hypothetical protein
MVWVRRGGSMRRLGALLLLFAFLPCWLHAQKTRYGQGLPRAKPGVSFPIKVHISAIRLVGACAILGYEYPGYEYEDVVHADATLDGRKVELCGGVPLRSGTYDLPLLPGDYEARFLKGPRPARGTPLSQEYEVLLPDGTVWRSAVSGFSE